MLLGPVRDKTLLGSVWLYSTVVLGQAWCGSYNSSHNELKFVSIAIWVLCSSGRSLELPLAT